MSGTSGECRWCPGDHGLGAERGTESRAVTEVARNERVGWLDMRKWGTESALSERGTFGVRFSLSQKSWRWLVAGLFSRSPGDLPPVGLPAPCSPLLCH